MPSLGILLLAFLVIRNRVEIDRRILSVWAARRAPLPGEGEVAWIRHVMGALRSGSALDECLLRAGPPSAEWISPALLQHASLSGAPVLGALSHLRARLESRIRGLRRARALTAQARTQSFAIAVLPWFLLAAWALIDPRAIGEAAALPWCWLLWGAALTLSGAALVWMGRMVTRACEPASEEDGLLEEHLPAVILSLLGQVAAGMAVDEAATQASLHLPEPLRPRLLRESDGALGEVSTLLARARRDGTPIRTELESLLTDIDSRRDARIETALQKLPLRALLPLFLCSFPAAALVLTTLILPLLAGLS
ncbi:MAG: hypothetical protein HUU37_05790 [Bdellovibrionales bacterium]|nr:hypothetical protein [Bdellovibrionales bacterium]